MWKGSGKMAYMSSDMSFPLRVSMTKCLQVHGQSSSMQCTLYCSGKCMYWYVRVKRILVFIYLGSGDLYEKVEALGQVFFFFGGGEGLHMRYIEEKLCQNLAH